MRRAAGAVLLAAGLLGCAPARTSSPEAGRGAGEVVVLTARPGSGQRYVGSSACRGCHAAVWESWRAGPHAASLAILGAAEASRPACLRCHATGYGEPLGYAQAPGAQDLGAVGCEACHGPGADHARSRFPAFVPTATGGECPPCEVNRLCRGCHTPAHSPGFDLARDLARVTCRPAATTRSAP